MKPLAFLLVALLVLSTSFSQDSLKIIDYSKTISELKSENRQLNEKVDILNSTNDKILNSVYWTIGAILTVLIGLSVWNSIKNQKLNEEKFKEHLETTKKQLEVSLNDQITKSVNSKSFSEISSVKLELSNLKSALNSFKEDYLVDNFKYHPYHKLADESSTLIDLIELVTKNEMGHSYESLLEGLKNYLKANGYVFYANKPKLFNYLDTYFTDPKFKYQVAEIKELLKNLKD